VFENKLYIYGGLDI
jgi:hypothetical protein